MLDKNEFRPYFKITYNQPDLIFIRRICQKRARRHFSGDEESRSQIRFIAQGGLRIALLTSARVR